MQDAASRRGLANRELEHAAKALLANDGQLTRGRPVGGDDVLGHGMWCPSSSWNPGEGGRGGPGDEGEGGERDRELTRRGNRGQDRVLEPERLERRAREIALEELLAGALPCGEDDPAIRRELGASPEADGTERHFLHRRVGGGRRSGAQPGDKSSRDKARDQGNRPTTVFWSEPSPVSKWTAARRPIEAPRGRTPDRARTETGPPAPLRGSGGSAASEEEGRPPEVEARREVWRGRSRP